MAASIAHELNQPLVGVRGLAEHLAHRHRPRMGHPAGKAAGEARPDRGTSRPHVAHHRTRPDVRPEAGKPEVRPVQLNDVVRAAVGMVGDHFRVRGHCRGVRTGGTPAGGPREPVFPGRSGLESHDQRPRRRRWKRSRPPPGVPTTRAPSCSGRDASGRRSGARVIQVIDEGVRHPAGNPAQGLRAVLHDQSRRTRARGSGWRSASISSSSSAARSESQSEPGRGTHGHRIAIPAAKPDNEGRSADATATRSKPLLTKSCWPTTRKSSTRRIRRLLAATRGSRWTTPATGAPRCKRSRPATTTWPWSTCDAGHGWAFRCCEQVRGNASRDAGGHHHRAPGPGDGRRRLAAGGGRLSRQADQAGGVGRRAGEGAATAAAAQRQAARFRKPSAGSRPGPPPAPPGQNWWETSPATEESAGRSARPSRRVARWC